MTNSEEKYLIYLSAILHDIGKFYQRADEKKGDSFNFLSKNLWDNPGVYCPSFNGRFSHKHVLWTAQFFEDQKEIFRNVLPDAYKKLESLAASHHNPHPGNILEQIIQKADHWSSGIDRTSPLGMEDDKDETEKVEKKNFKQVEMCSVFEHLFEDEKSKPYKYKLPISALRLEEDFFPKSGFNEGQGYLELWTEFINEFKTIKSGSLEGFCESVLFILHKYLVNVPSSTIHLPDVSLFDHSKTVAAFAVCLYDYLKEQNKLSSNLEIKNNEEAVLLVGGDLSGIQNYIYNVVSNKASKNLKGRSFYLQLIVDFVIRELLQELGLFKSNIVYSSGGGFYALAANTYSNIEKLKNLEKNVSDKLFDIHRTDLFLSIDYVSLCQDDLYNGKIGEKWKTLIENLNSKKRSKFKGKLSVSYADFFEPIGVGFNTQLDDITGEELSKDDTCKIDNELTVSKHTAKQIELGETLRNTNSIAFSRLKQGGETASYFYIQSPFSNDYCYFIENKTSPIFDNADVISINSTILNQNIKGNRNAFGFDFIGGNDFPKDKDGNILSFNDIGGNGEFKRIAVLRMDVDNLGSVFINGFSDNRKTFSRYTALSRSMDYFFKGYINTLRNKNENFKNYIFIVYSGGDDLFIVGKWDVVIDFAELIQKEFRKWVCFNKKLTLSAGISVVTTKFPVLKAAEMAGEAEKKAKQHVCNGQEKNAITIFDKALNWDYEYHLVKKLKDELIYFLSYKNDTPKSLLDKFSKLYEMKTEADKKQINPQWKWLMAYDFGRMKQQYRKDEELKKYIEQLEENILCNTYQKNKIQGNYHFLELLAIAARWSELLIRTNKN